VANSDKDIVITPNKGQSADPRIVFSGASSVLGPQNITLQVYPTENGTLSFEGSAGQLFSITNSLTGTIFSVNDVSGIPSIEVLDTGIIRLAQFNGRVLVGTGVDNGVDKIQVSGDVTATTFKGPLSGNATTATTLQNTRTIWGQNFNGGANVVGALTGVTTVSMNNQLTNTLATGTAPFAITSTTRVANLNVATAGTADVLTTSRSINGTSFNGSADIKTTEWFHSQRDFISGTLITTNINYAVSEGDPFVIEIRGNSYGNIIPFDIQYQGYIYNNTIINHGGYSNGTNLTGMVALNVGGNLCFWFPRQEYWHGFNVRAYVAYPTYALNRVTSITDTTKPSGTKEVALSANIRQSLHSGNFNSYSPTLTGQGASGTWGISITGNAATITGQANSATITASTAATANQIVLRDGNGDDFRRYGFASYFNMSHGVSGATADTIFYSSTDNYIRKNNATGFRASLNVPTRTGGDASGSWGISITGNAASVSGLTINNVSVPIDPNNVTQNQIGYANSISLFGQSDGGLYSSAYSSVWMHQIFGDFRTGQIAIRGKNNGTFQAWRTVLDSSNFSGYALPLSGGQMSGTIFNSATSLVIGNNGGVTRGYLYNDTSGFGLLNNGGGWAARIPFGTSDLEVTSNCRGASLGLNGGFRINDPGSAYGQFSNWVNLPGFHGFYSGNNSAHFYPNPGSYGAWLITGQRNGWSGLEFTPPSGGSTSLMMNRDAYGFHMNDTGWRFYVSGGTGYFPGDVVAYWSDERLKTNLRQLENEALDILGKFRAYRFNWNDKVTEYNIPIEPGKEEIGLIAQHVQSVLPDAVRINKTGGKSDQQDFDYLTINYDRITPLLVEGVNIHTDEITKLKEKVIRLEMLIQSLMGDKND